MLWRTSLLAGENQGKCAVAISVPTQGAMFPGVEIGGIVRQPGIACAAAGVIA
jgi:hypothetical protein